MSKRPKPDKPARTRSIGTTLIGLLLVPLLGLVGLWGFVASTTISKAASEYNLHRVGLGLYQDTQVLLLAFEKERATTFIWQSSPSRRRRANWRAFGTRATSRSPPSSAAAT